MVKCQIFDVDIKFKLKIGNCSNGFICNKNNTHFFEAFFKINNVLKSIVDILKKINLNFIIILEVQSYTTEINLSLESQKKVIF